MHLHEWLLRLCVGVDTIGTATLVSKPGELAAFPSWDLQSTKEAGTDTAGLSLAGLNTKSWHHVNSSRCTLMGCLLKAGVYQEEDLFHSENLKSFNASIFTVPWVYRTEFRLDPGESQHYFLQTHGISSKADIFINGQEIANKTSQAGSYAGHTFDISKIVQNKNALAVQVYPTDYDYDLALGFVDWNPYPPDNGTGVWRDIEIKQTGPVALGPLRVITDINLPVGDSSARITLKSVARNLEDYEITAELNGKILLESGDQEHEWKQSVKLAPLSSYELALSATLENPAIWWPKQWGKQPLYLGQLSVSVDSSVSDTAQRTFGIRQVASKLNSYNDTMFYVNGLPFQVIGAGYSADMFLRWDSEKFATQARLMLDLGHNTVRLEGKNEHPELYEIADRMGLMVMAGWECCDKWEAWSYNDNLPVKSEWTAYDYEIANSSMRHESLMQQGHPSLLAYLVGSDFWPNDEATQIYLTAFKHADWHAPIIASASRQGFPKLLGPSGLKMDGPYDWVPPNYWYDVEPSEDRLGAAFGFGSELGAGVGTPEMGSLKKFLSSSDLEDLWKQPNKGLYHMSTSVSSFYDRKIYNDALWARHGAPTSLEDYLLKAQIMDYEATRAQFEGFSAFWNKERPATGLIYWMLNNAWPSLHWNLFDYYTHTAGSYFGAKVGTRREHVAYDYQHQAVYLINRSTDNKGSRTIAVNIIDTNGKEIYNDTKTAVTEPNTSKNVIDLSGTLESVEGVVFLRLTLKNEKAITLSRNVYWLADAIDTLDWDSSNWFYTPVTEYADFTPLNGLQIANISLSVVPDSGPEGTTSLVIENSSGVPAFFVRLNVVDENDEDALPVFWSDNYVTLWPHEKLVVRFESRGAAAVQASGMNVEKSKVEF
ncbi:glycoside hydrolase family 2 protein [Biscogniauxia mediterranea]|nr:glycoside hydrolase family 2 protein [Biscogniauxia mediterranea]